MKRNQEILLCDLDAFFASVEQLDHPKLRGKPVVVGGSPEGRGVVSTCSYEARVYGVRSAMPMKKALALCPQAIVLEGRMHRYKEFSDAVLRIYEQYTPDIEVVSIDEAYLVVPQGQGLKIGHLIHIEVRDRLDLTVSVGVSKNKLLAKISCELVKPNRVGSLWPAEVETVLWPLSVRVLPGVGPVTAENLKRIGIEKVRDLALYPVDALKRVLGSNAAAMHGFAHGHDERPLEIEREVKSLSEETTFSEDIYDKDMILTTLLELSAGVGYRLRKANYLSRTITLKLRFSDFRTITRGKTLPEAVDSDSVIYQCVRNLFELHRGKPPWRLIGVQASGLEQGGQLSLLQPSPGEVKEKKLTAARDQLHRKYGTDVIFQARRLRPKKDQ